jgi:hypothetical protein
MDANGCQDSLPGGFWFTSSCSIGFEIGGGLQASGSDGDLIIYNAQGGTAPYTYFLDGIHYQSSQTFTGLVPELYNAYVKDATGKVAIEAWYVFANCRILTATAISAASCRQNNASITVKASQGTVPYEYSLDGINYQSSNIFTGLAIGTYNIYVTDADNNTGFAQSVIVGNNCPQIAVLSTDDICGANN